MPTLNAAWRTICRFIARTNTPATADPNIGRTNCNVPVTAQTGSSRLRGIYERVREQVLEPQRNSELARQEEIRRDRRADRKSLCLLMRLLNEEQRQEFRNFRHFHVTGGSSGNRYRIRVGMIANIDVLRSDGKVNHRLCAHPTGIPVYDVMAAQLLHLQDPVTEQQFLKRANAQLASAQDRVLPGSVWFV
jgi:hypothetical protein